MWEWRTIARSPTGALSESGTADRQEVECPLCVAAVRQSKIRRRDGRHEARVEGFGQRERRVEAVPSHPERQLVCAQLAGMEHTQDLDLAEVAFEQLPVLTERVLAKVPGVLRL